jgi:hypothetical protein
MSLFVFWLRLFLNTEAYVMFSVWEVSTVPLLVSVTLEFNYLIIHGLSVGKYYGWLKVETG